MDIVLGVDIHKELFDRWPSARAVYHTPAMQRLALLMQCGPVFTVHPSAIHTRLQHSVGVAILADRVVQQLRAECLCEYITERQHELVVLGALMHDIGHGPWSHLWSEIDRTYDHEQWSGHIAQEILASGVAGMFTASEQRCVVNIIQGRVTDGRHDHWMYEIVNNRRFPLDVDKMDYLVRDTFMIYGPLSKYMQLRASVRDLIDNVRIDEETGQLVYAFATVSDAYLLSQQRHALGRDVYFSHAVRVVGEKIKAHAQRLVPEIACRSTDWDVLPDEHDVIVLPDEYMQYSQLASEYRPRPVAHCGAGSDDPFKEVVFYTEKQYDGNEFCTTL